MITTRSFAVLAALLTALLTAARLAASDCLVEDYLPLGEWEPCALRKIGEQPDSSASPPAPTSRPLPNTSGDLAVRIATPPGADFNVLEIARPSQHPRAPISRRFWAPAARWGHFATLNKRHTDEAKG
jgi:hypothetical protein